MAKNDEAALRNSDSSWYLDLEPGGDCSMEFGWCRVKTSLFPLSRSTLAKTSKPNSIPTNIMRKRTPSESIKLRENQKASNRGERGKNILPEQKLTGLSNHEFVQNMEDDIDDLYILESSIEKADAA